MKAEITPTDSLKKGLILYRASADTNILEISTVYIDEWEVRSIGKKYRSKYATSVIDDDDDSIYINLAMREVGETLDKAGNWLETIPPLHREEFFADDERLPSGFYTTKEQALKYAIKEKKMELQSHRQKLEDEKTDPDPVVTKYNQYRVDCNIAELKLMKATLKLYA